MRVVNIVHESSLWYIYM